MKADLFTSLIILMWYFFFRYFFSLVIVFKRETFLGVTREMAFQTVAPHYIVTVFLYSQRGCKWIKRFACYSTILIICFYCHLPFSPQLWTHLTLRLIMLFVALHLDFATLDVSYYPLLRLLKVVFDSCQFNMLYDLSSQYSTLISNERRICVKVLNMIDVTFYFKMKIHIFTHHITV